RGVEPAASRAQMAERPSHRWRRRQAQKESLAMPCLELTRTDGLLAIRMARPKANALNAQMLEELRAAFATAANDAGVRGVVLASAVPGIFSAGFDARESFPYGPAEIKAFFGGFLQLTHGILDLPKPAVAAIEGYAMAG